MFSVVNSPMLRRSLTLKLCLHEHQELPMSMYARMIVISVSAGNAAVLHGFIKTPQHTAVPLTRVTAENRRYPKCVLFLPLFQGQ